jgi:acyl-CoA thioester hydrolase
VIETYRGNVYRWELDQYDHFTVAFYFQRIDDATLVLLDALGLDRTRFRTADVYVRYQKEFHAGDLLHVSSSVTGVTDDGFVAGHLIVNSETGEVATTVEQRFVVETGAKPLTAGERASLEARREAWNAPARERRAPPKTLDGFRDAALDVIRPAEQNGMGRIGLPAYVHRFSAANGHVIAAFGMTAEYMRGERRGFSTFEFQLSLSGEVAIGDVVRVRSALLHLGSSSMRIHHRMTNERTGTEIAKLDQLGVHLDTDARKSTPLPDVMRAKAKAVLVPTA